MDRKKINIKAILLIGVALIMMFGFMPGGTLAVTENPAGGIFIKDEGTEHFAMEGHSTNNQVVAELAWRYDDYVYFALSCHKNVTIDPAAFQINGVTVGEGNTFLLNQGVDIKLYDGPESTTPPEEYDADVEGNNRIWLVGRIHLSDSNMSLSFENVSHAVGWKISGVTYDTDLTVSHKYGSAEPVMDFDQSESTLAVGQEISILPVPKEGYEYTSVSVKFGTTEITDLESHGITKDENGNLSFTVTNEMIAADGVYIEYVYTAVYPLTIHYVYEGGSKAADDYSETLAEGDSYSVTSPVIEGYTASREVVSGTMPAQAVEETVTYTKTNYTLTVEYVFKDGTTAAPTYTQQVPYSEQYSVNSPEVTGYSPDRTVVTGTMPAEDHKETVVYTANDYQLTVHYVYENGGGTAAPDHTETIKYGAEYSVTSPTITGYTPDTNVVSGTMPAQNVEVTVTYTVNEHTLTINYIYEDGTTAATTVSKTVPYNTQYSETSPTITGYTPDTPVVSGTMPDEDVDVTVKYTANEYPLTVHYVYAQGGTAAPDHTETVKYGAEYSVTSPTVTGYKPDKSVVSGTMPAQAVEETVTYTVNQHKLTINYVYEDGTTAAPTVSKTLPYNTQYSETSPVIENYTASQEVVEGTMPDDDVTVTVTYTEIPPVTHTLTVHYVYSTGGTAAEDHVETVAEGASYNVESPAIEEYTPDKTIVSGTMATADIEETVTYTKNTYPLTILYVYADSSTAADTHSEQLSKDDPYNVTSPTIEGYTADKTVVEGSMPGEALTVTVTYTVNSYKLTVHYVYEDGATAADDHVEPSVNYGAAYSVESPAIEGYTPDTATVAGNMPAADVEKTVTYTANKYTLTIHYVYEDGTTAAPDHSAQIPFKGTYNVASPEVTGHTPDKDVVDGEMPAENVTVTVTYTANSYNLTVKYVYKDGSEAAPTYTETVDYGKAYNVESPSVEGYTPDKATVSGTMPAEDVEVTVTYSNGSDQPATGLSNYSMLLIALQYLCLIAGAVAVVKKQRKIRSDR